MATPAAGTILAPPKPPVINQTPIAGDTGTGLIGQAQTYSAQEGTAKADLTGTGFTGAQTTGTGFTGAQTTGNGYDSTDWNSSDDQSVAGQVKKIIASGSPLNQQAEARSLGQANARGLINTSIAVGAGQSALYDAALPIATQDATTAANRNQFNAGQKTAASQFTAQAGNTANLANQASTNQGAQFTASADNTAKLANQASTNQGAQFTAAQKQAAETTNQAATNQQKLVNQSATNEARAQGAAANNSLQAQTNALRQQAAQGNQDAANKVALLDMDNQFKASITNADAANKVQLQELSDSAKTGLSTIEANYRTLMQTSSSASGLYESAVNNITRIAADPNMDAASKAASINAIQGHLKASMDALGSINGIDLGSLLDFGAPAGATNAATTNAGNDTTTGGVQP